MTATNSHLEVVAPSAAHAPPPGSTDRDIYQYNLVLKYQDALARSGQGNAVDADGEQDLIDLLDDLDDLLRWAVNNHLRGHPEAGGDEQFADYLSQVRLACIEGARSYEPERQVKFRSYLLNARSGPVTAALRALTTSQAGAAGWSRSEARVARYAHAARTDLRTSGKEPSVQEIADEVHTRCYLWAVGRVEAQWRDDGRPLPPDSGPGSGALATKRDREAYDKLIKEGTWKALGSIGELLSALDRPQSLDAMVTEPVTLSAQAHARSSNSASDPRTSALVRLSTLGMGSQQRDALLAHLAADGDDPTRGTGEHGQTTRTLRRGRALLADALAASRARLGAPHAHFAALSPTLDRQFGDQTLTRGSGAQLRAAVLAGQ